VLILNAGETRCFAGHSSEEEASSPCSQIAGEHHDAKLLYESLLRQYRQVDWISKEILIPNHPHCTHTVRAGAAS
jgi:hypothetical protein